MWSAWIISYVYTFLFFVHKISSWLNFDCFRASTYIGCPHFKLTRILLVWISCCMIKHLNYLKLRHLNGVGWLVSDKLVLWIQWYFLFTCPPTLICFFLVRHALEFCPRRFGLTIWKFLVYHNKHWCVCQLVKHRRTLKIPMLSAYLVSCQHISLTAAKTRILMLTAAEFDWCSTLSVINHEFYSDSFRLSMDSKCVDPISASTQLNGHVFNGKAKLLRKKYGAKLVLSSTISKFLKHFFTFWSGRKQMDFRLSLQKTSYPRQENKVCSTTREKQDRYRIKHTQTETCKWLLSHLLTHTAAQS